MKFLPTVNLWDAQTQDDLLSGKLKLNPGQWVQCGSGKKSRFCGVTKSGTIVATHAENKNGKLVVDNERFNDHLMYWKGMRPDPQLTLFNKYAG